jgi:hypothetical protein
MVNVHNIFIIFFLFSFLFIVHLFTSSLSIIIFLAAPRPTFYRRPLPPSPLALAMRPCPHQRKCSRGKSDMTMLGPPERESYEKLIILGPALSSHISRQVYFSQLHQRSGAGEEPFGSCVELHKMPNLI